VVRPAVSRPQGHAAPMWTRSTWDAIFRRARHRWLMVSWTLGEVQRDLETLSETTFFSSLPLLLAWTSLARWTSHQDPRLQK
jgi:hypothetical protein